jgi:hypothetical protein
MKLTALKQTLIPMLLCLVAFTSTTTLTAQPTITSFTPTNAAVGATVTITGTSFNTTAVNNVVFFGATRATVTAATATSLSVTVPTGATFAPITVLNTATTLAAYSTQFFNPTFTPNKGSITTTDIAPKVGFTTGIGPNSVAIGDMDGDGKPDLAIANNSSNTVSVLRNTGSSGTVSFATKVDFATGSYPVSVAIGDIDGDGNPDLAFTNYSSNTVSVLRNTGSSGTVNFAPRVNFAAGASPYSVAIGDIDGDGKPDLAIANYNDNTVSVLRNIGSSGTVVFATKVDFATGTGPISVAIGDIDGDGKPDLATANYTNNTVSVLRNTGSSGTVSFATRVNFATGTNPISVAIGDIDGDGKPDLAIANLADNTVSVLRNTGSSGMVNFDTKVDFATGSGPISVAIGDIDGDGKPDLAIANVSSYTVSVLRNTGSSGTVSFAPKVDFATGAGPQSVAIGDIDGDGNPDLAIANLSSSTVSVLRNTPELNNANLSSLTTTAGTIAPTFASATIAYTASVGNATTSVTVTPTKADANATIEVQVNSGGYSTVISGNASSALSLNVGSNTIDVKVTAEDGTTIKTYTITVTRAYAPPGNALDFNGGQYVRTNNIIIAQPYTIETWVMYKQGVARICATDNNNLIIDDYAGAKQIRCYVSLTTLLSKPNVVEYNKWMHVACVVDGGNSKIYVNGVDVTLSGSLPTTALNASSFDLGISGPPLNQVPLHGKMDEFRV